jgi:nitrite reductase/ring-hydroxylating ferredoxin subunit
MVSYKTYTQLLESLKKHNLYFKEFTLVTGGDYLPDDIDWNFKDVLHGHYIHTQFVPYPMNFTDDTIAQIFIQNILWFKVPVIVYQYDSGPDNLTYVSTLLNFTMIVNTKFVRRKNKTDAVTKYNIGSSKILVKLFFPLIKYLITKNYNFLMNEDTPMRVRRGELRKMGAEFIKYGDKYTHRETMELNKSKCKFKASLFKSKIASKCKTIRKSENGTISEFISGQSDIWGLRGIIENNKVTIYPRMCDHEGACLDEAKFQNMNIVCPWHNKKIKPIFSQGIKNEEVVFNHMQKIYRLKFKKNKINIDFI